MYISGISYRFYNGNLNALSANFTQWSKTLKQLVGKLPTNCLTVFDHFVGLALKGLMVNIAPEVNNSLYLRISGL